MKLKYRIAQDEDDCDGDEQELSDKFTVDKKYINSDPKVQHLILKLRLANIYVATIMKRVINYGRKHTYKEFKDILRSNSPICVISQHLLTKICDASAISYQMSTHKHPKVVSYWMNLRSTSKGKAHISVDATLLKHLMELQDRITVLLATIHNWFPENGSYLQKEHICAKNTDVLEDSGIFAKISSKLVVNVIHNRKYPIMRDTSITDSKDLELDTNITRMRHYFTVLDGSLDDLSKEFQRKKVQVLDAQRGKQNELDDEVCEEYTVRLPHILDLARSDSDHFHRPTLFPLLPVLSKEQVNIEPEDSFHVSSVSPSSAPPPSTPPASTPPPGTPPPSTPPKIVETEDKQAQAKISLPSKEKLNTPAQTENTQYAPQTTQTEPMKSPEGDITKVLDDISQYADADNINRPEKCECKSTMTSGGKTVDQSTNINKPAKNQARVVIIDKPFLIENDDYDKWKTHKDEGEGTKPKKHLLQKCICIYKDNLNKFLTKGNMDRCKSAGTMCADKCSCPHHKKII